MASWRWLGGLDNTGSPGDSLDLCARWQSLSVHSWSPQSFWTCHTSYSFDRIFFFFFFPRYVRICLYCALWYGYICIWESLFYVYRLCLWIVKTIIWLRGYILFISLFSGHLKILCQCHIMLYLCNTLLLFYNAYHDVKH